ncbi:MAG: acyl-CoA dehydrogenase family protein [bacterium]|nr:acyl-CoA dehydrogenase family protein [bacterium]
MHNLQLTEDQDLIVDTARKFVEDVVAPNVLDQDEHRKFARAEFDGLAELGLFGLCVGEDAGGAGLGLVPFVAAVEAIGRESASVARLFIGQVQCAAVLEVAGHDDLEPVMMGGKLAVFVGGEHGLTADGGAVSGTAELVPGGGEADTFYVVAKAGDALQVLAVDASAAKRDALTSLGLASTAPARVTFDNTAATVVLEGDAAQQAIDKAQQLGWIGVAALAVGGGHASIDAAKKHAGERIAFGKPLSKQHAVMRKVIESRQGCDAARQLAMHAARLADAGIDATQTALQARVLAVDAMVHAADEAIQIHGGFGYTVEYHVERHYRDGKTLEVLDAGSEKLRDRLAALEA